MKNSNTCPKCKSTNVAKVKAFKTGSASNIIQLTKWATKNAYFDRYVCLSCGFLEDYANVDEKIWQKWLDEQKEENSLDSDFV